MNYQKKMRVAQQKLSGRWNLHDLSDAVGSGYKTARALAIAMANLQMIFIVDTDNGLVFGFRRRPWKMLKAPARSVGKN